MNLRMSLLLGLLVSAAAHAQCVTIPLSAPGVSPVVTISSCTPVVPPVAPPVVVAPLAVAPAALPPATQYGTYSQPLASYVTGGKPPYTFALTSQSGYNPATWAIKGSSLVASQLLNVETANLVIKVTDSAAKTASATFAITTNRTIPAGAKALGYTKLIYASKPVLSQIGFGPYGTDNKTPWYSGMNYTTTVPPASLYSMSPSGVLLLHQSGAGTGPSLTTPTIMGARPAVAGDFIGASTLPLIPVGRGYYIDYTVQVISGASSTIRPAVWQLPSQHSNPGSQAIDPLNPSAGQQWLEKDTWEGASSLNGKQSKGNYIGWNGNTPYSTYIKAQTNVNTSNPVIPSHDTTLERAYGYSWTPATATSARWLDNAAGGSWQAHTAAGVMTGEYLAWANKATDYPIISAYNDGTGPFTMAVYEVAVYGPP